MRAHPTAMSSSARVINMARFSTRFAASTITAFWDLIRKNSSTCPLLTLLLIQIVAISGNRQVWRVSPPLR